jgi:hypothetical protein
MTTLTNMPVEIECNSCTSVQVPEMPFVQRTAITGMQASISPDACRFASGDQGHFQNIDPRSMDCAIAFATPSRRMENAARQTPALLTMPHALRHYWVHKAKALLLNLFEGLK